jgi:hypothetical protein
MGNGKDGMKDWIDNFYLLTGGGTMVGVQENFLPYLFASISIHGGFYGAERGVEIESVLSDIVKVADRILVRPRLKSPSKSSRSMKTTPNSNTDPREANRRLEEIANRLNKSEEERLGRPLRTTALDEILSSGSDLISLPVSQAVSREVQSQDQE